MKALCYIAAAIILSMVHRAIGNELNALRDNDASAIELGNTYRWTLSISDGPLNFIQVGTRVGNQLKLTTAEIKGVYVVNFSSPRFINNNSLNDPVGLYIPNLGGQYQIRLNNRIISSGDEDKHYRDILIPIPPQLLVSSNNRLEVSFSSNVDLFAGLWRGVPVLGYWSSIDKIKSATEFFQRDLPLFASLLLCLASLFFFVIRFSLGRKHSRYFNFGFSLLSWGVY